MAKWYIILFLLTPLAWSSAQWENISWEVPLSSSPTRVGDALFLRTSLTGIYRSRDDGKTWQLFTNGLGPHAVAYSYFTHDGLYLYLNPSGHSEPWQLAFGSGTFRAHWADDGWSFLPNGAIASGNREGFLSISRDSIFRWETGTDKSTILFFTTNRGEWWEERRTGFHDPVKIVSAHRMGDRIIINPNLSIVEHRQSMLLNGLYYTTDFGEHWIQGGIRMSGNTVGNNINVLFAQDSVVIARTNNYYTEYDILRSVDNGITFDTIKLPVSISNGNFSYSRNGSFIYLLDYSKGDIYLTSDIGGSWSAMPFTDTSETRVNSIIPFGESTLVWVNGVGLYKYSQDLRHGVPYPTGTVAEFKSDLKLAFGPVVIAGSDVWGPAKKTLHVSKDHGTTWSVIVPDSNVSILGGTYAEAEGVVYGAGGVPNFPPALPAVYRSLDSGLTWNLVRRFSFKDPLGVITAHGSKVLLLGQAFPLAMQTFQALSTDKGLSWDTTVHLRLPFRADSGKMFLVGDDLIAFHRNKGKVFRSDDGNTWEEITFNLPDSIPIYGFASIGERLILYGKATNYSDKITRPSNYVLDRHSSQWQPSIGSLSYGREFTSIVPHGDKLFATVINYRTLPPLESGGMIYFSRDSGLTWSRTAEGTISAARKLTIGSHYLYLEHDAFSYGSSIYRFPLAKAYVATPEQEKDLIITNIIRNASGLEFQLTAPTNSSASIRLFDVLGRLLYEQHEAVQQGIQQVLLGYPAIRSGTYVIEVSIPGATALRYYNAIQ